MSLVQKKCTACDASTPKLGPQDIALLQPEVPGWQVNQVSEGGHQVPKLHKRFKHQDFVQAMAFVNGLAQLAEAEGHHPDFAVRYNVVDVTLWTHAIGGLSDNDFILAAKIDALPGVART